MIALDTDALIDLFRGEESLRKALDALSGPFCTSIINFQELMFGLDFSNPSHRSEEQFYEEILDSLFLFPLSKETSKKASMVFWELRMKGKEIGRFDCMVAGILLTYGADAIVTRNAKDFQRIPGMTVISY